MNQASWASYKLRTWSGGRGRTATVRLGKTVNCQHTCFGPRLLPIRAVSSPAARFHIAPLLGRVSVFYLPLAHGSGVGNVARQDSVIPSLLSHYKRSPRLFDARFQLALIHSGIDRDLRLVKGRRKRLSRHPAYDRCHKQTKGGRDIAA
jgi:hypothetical protein